jgi:hypothetical protein
MMPRRTKKRRGVGEAIEKEEKLQIYSRANNTKCDYQKKKKKNSENKQKQNNAQGKFQCAKAW